VLEEHLYGILRKKTLAKLRRNCGADGVYSGAETPSLRMTWQELRASSAAVSGLVQSCSESNTSWRCSMPVNSTLRRL